MKVLKRGFMLRTNQILKYSILPIMLFGVTYFYRSPSYPSSFEVTDESHRIQFRGKQDFAGATLVNLDEDEEQEIYIPGSGSNNLLLKRNNHDFQVIHIPELLDREGLAFSVTACDLDSDGRDEILILNRPDMKTGASHSRIVKFKNGKWVDILSKTDPIKNAIDFGYSASCIDRKGDGKYGLIIPKENGKISYLESNDGTIIDIATSIGMAFSSKGRSVLGVPGPQGRTNIYVGNENGPNFYFMNKGDGTFSEKAADVGLLDPHFDARGISLIDFNYDDMPDVIYGNHYGPTFIMQQTREGKFIDVTPEKMKMSYAVNATVVGDFNLDGYEDVYLNNIRGSNRLFARFESNWFLLENETLAEKDLFGISTIAGDLDMNGSFEILNTHGDGALLPITLYSVRPVNQWIKFNVKYVSGGIPRGAIVRLRTTKRDSVRVISTGSGRFANYSSEIMFGLIKDETVLSAEVILPSGKKIPFKDEIKLNRTNELRI